MKDRQLLKLDSLFQTELISVLQLSDGKKEGEVSLKYYNMKIESFLENWSPSQMKDFFEDDKIENSN